MMVVIYLHELRWAGILLDLQNNILRMIAKGEPLADTAARICEALEAVLPEASVSIMSVDRAGVLHTLAAPALPVGFLDGFDGSLLGPMVGSCGSAAYHQVPVSVADIANDPLWENFRDRALSLGFKSCYSLPIIGVDGDTIGVVAFYQPGFRDVTDQERERICACIELCQLAMLRHERVVDRERRATVDALTGLGNRAAFNAALSRVPCDKPGTWALFMIDLDNLKVVNDTFGHQAGDALIRTASERIAGTMRPDLTFRLGGDEFAVLIQRAEALRDLDVAAARIFASLDETADCDGHAIVPKATIGGAVFSAQDADSEDVIQNADFALYHAKETGRGGFVRYWPGIGTRMTHRRDAVRNVMAALAEDRIEAFYQPVMRLDSREIVGFEALCRLRTRSGSYVSAANFKDAMSDAHVASELTGRMLSIVAGDVRRWMDAGLAFQHVGVNISTADFYKGRLMAQIAESFGAADVPFDHLILEVAESVYLGQRDRVVAEEIKALRASGLRIALDDFGTGFASLTQLLTMPVDIIKVDPTFVRGLMPGEPGLAIVRGLVGIARELGMRVVAEGVEAEAQAAQLWAVGCELGQGFAFSEAVRSDVATKLLRGNGQHVQVAVSLGAEGRDRNYGHGWILQPTGTG